MSLQTPEQTEVAQAREQVREWLGVTHFESDEALASAALARIREEYGLTLHARWNSEGLMFSTQWTSSGRERLSVLPCEFTAEHFDQARLLACAGALEAAPWLPCGAPAARHSLDHLGICCPTRPDSASLS